MAWIDNDLYSHCSRNPNDGMNPCTMLWRSTYSDRYDEAKSRGICLRSWVSPKWPSAYWNMIPDGGMTWYNLIYPVSLSKVWRNADPPTGMTPHWCYVKIYFNLRLVSESTIANNNCGSPGWMSLKLMDLHGSSWQLHRFDAFKAASLGMVLWFLSEMNSRKQKTLYQASSMFDEVNQGGNSSNEKTGCEQDRFKM